VSRPLVALALVALAAVATAAVFAVLYVTKDVPGEGVGGEPVR
jgi:hypothetical protein